MKVDPNKSASQNVLDLLNSVNNKQLTQADVELLKPVAITPDADGCNTELEIKARGPFTHTGSVKFRYKRFSFPTIPSTEIALSVSDPDQAKLIASLATRYKFHPEAFQLVGNIPNPKAVGNGVKAKLTLKVKDANQYLYTPGETSVSTELTDASVVRRGNMLFGTRY